MFKKIIAVTNDIFNNSKGIQAVETPDSEKKTVLRISISLVIITFLIIYIKNKK